MGHTGYLLHKATLPKPENVSALPNTYRQPKGGNQNEDTKKHVPNERTEQNSKKKGAYKMEISYPVDADFKTLVIRILNELRRRVDELSENFNKEMGNIKMETENIKKYQVEMKDTLTKTKKSL